MINSLLSAFLMYSRIPVPSVEWKEENRRYSLGFFPLVGAVIGAVLVLWRYLCGTFELGQMIFAAGAVIIPVIITGGIHLDGFCDVTDAASSYADKAKRLEILSDPHIGSFAVMRVCLYLIAQTALFTRVTDVRGAVFAACGFVISRAASGFAAVNFKAAKSGGTLQSFVKPSHKTAVLALDGAFAAAAVITAAVISPARAAAGAVLTAVTVLYSRKRAYTLFGGYTGDVCGWQLQLTEIAWTAVLLDNRL